MPRRGLGQQHRAAPRWRSLLMLLARHWRLPWLAAAQASLIPLSGAAAATSAAGASQPHAARSLKVLGEQLAPAYTDFLAALMSEGSLFCGGSLVAPNAVLTAAHCFDEGGGALAAAADGITVRLNWPDLRLPAPPGGEEHAVARIVTHPAYNGTGEAAGDLALLILETPSAQAPILLPPPEGLNLTEGQQMWAAWYSAEGADFGTVARWFYTDAFESAACSRIWEAWGKEEEAGAWNATSASLCSALQPEDAGSCTGDSGGPLVLGEDTETLTLAGVLSWGTGASPCAPGSQEINVWASMIDPGHRAWIDAELLKLEPAAAPAA